MFEYSEKTTCKVKHTSYIIKGNNRKFPIILKEVF